MLYFRSGALDRLVLCAHCLGLRLLLLLLVSALYLLYSVLIHALLIVWGYSSSYFFWYSLFTLLSANACFTSSSYLFWYALSHSSLSLSFSPSLSFAPSRSCRLSLYSPLLHLYLPPYIHTYVNHAHTQARCVHVMRDAYACTYVSAYAYEACMRECSHAYITHTRACMHRACMHITHTQARCAHAHLSTKL